MKRLSQSSVMWDEKENYTNKYTEQYFLNLENSGLEKLSFNYFPLLEFIFFL